MPETTAGCYRSVADGIVVAVRVTPNAKQDSIDGVGQLADGSAVLHIRLRAVAEEGKANAALCRFMAEAMGVAKSAVTIERGSKSRLKTVGISGPPALLAAKAARWPARKSATAERD